VFKVTPVYSIEFYFLFNKTPHNCNDHNSLKGVYARITTVHYLEKTL